MADRSKCIVLLLALAASIASVTAQSTDIKVVFRKGNDLFTIGSDGQTRPLTDDGVPKGNPLWSKDGTKIAFERQIDSSVAIDDLVVVDPITGKTLNDIHVRPTTSGGIDSIRYIEGIQWLTEDKIAAYGSVNPSTVNVAVIDRKTGGEIMDYTDDGGGVAFSPDGEHAATINGMPHFSPESEWQPELEIDNRRIFPSDGVHACILSSPAWSDDGKNIAVIVADYQSKQRSIAICDLKGSCRSTLLPPGETDSVHTFEIQWTGEKVFATSSEGTWSMEPGISKAIASAQVRSPKVNAENLKPNAYDTPLDLQTKTHAIGGDSALKLLKQIQAVGGVEFDFWCKECALAYLPRKAPRW